MIHMWLLCARVVIWEVLAFPSMGRGSAQTKAILAPSPTASSGMFQSKSLENGFVFHFSILVMELFSEFFFKWIFPSPVCLVWFALV